MTYSKRELYALGEPLGESVTRRKPGGGYVCGGGGGGSSSSSSSTTNVDKRMAVGDGGIGASAENSTVTINSVDGAIVARALDTVDVANATAGHGLDALLNAADKLFSRGQGLIGQTQQAVAQAYDQAAQTKQGTIDNKTIVVLGVAAAVTVAAVAYSKRKAA